MLSQLLLILSLISLSSSETVKKFNVKDNDVSAWLTTVDPSSGSVIRLLEQQSGSSFKKSINETASSVQFQIDIDNKKQFILGYGAGLPQGSAYVLIKLKNSNYDLYNQVLQKLFGTGNDNAAINILRFPIGSCDFSLTSTTYDEVSGDYSLDNFAIDADSWNIVSVLKDVLAINPGLVVMASPWSAPSWLKTWNSLVAYSNDNTLISSDEAYDTYASYLVKVFEAYEAQGIPIQYFTLQNEPLFGTSSEYPGMYFSADQEARLGTLVHAKLGDRVKLLAYDHNWDAPEYPTSVLQQAGDSFVGTAWHCYGGTMSTAQELLHSTLPNFEQHLTECTGSFPDGCDITRGMEGFGWNHEWDMSNILLGGASHWSSSGVKWILALDETCGPTLPAVSYKSGRPLVSIPSWATSMEDIHFNQDYHSIRHMSQFLSPDNVNTRHTTSTDDKKAKTDKEGGSLLSSTNTNRVDSYVASGWANNLILESFFNQQTGVVTVIAMNTDHDNEVDLGLQGAGVSFWDTLPVFSTKVYQWSTY